MWAVIPIKRYFVYKSGYDHLLSTVESRTFFGIQWGGWYFVYNTLPFGWKISPFVYHSTGLVVSNFFRSMGIPCSLYIDDRHNGQPQIPPNQGAYVNLSSCEISYLFGSLLSDQAGIFSWFTQVHPDAS